MVPGRRKAVLGVVIFHRGVELWDNKKCQESVSKVPFSFLVILYELMNLLQIATSRGCFVILSMTKRTFNTPS